MRHPIGICLAVASVAACSNPGGNNGVAANEAGNAAAANPAPAPAPPPAANTVAGNNMAAAAPAAAYTANGFEPGWALSIAGGQMVYQSQNGPNLTVPAPAPQTVNNGLKYVTSQLTVTIIHTPCQGVNEHNYADTVQVDVAGQTLNGCGE